MAVKGSFILRLDPLAIKEMLRMDRAYLRIRQRGGGVLRMPIVCDGQAQIRLSPVTV
jgi:hypothetical protein